MPYSKARIQTARIFKNRDRQIISSSTENVRPCESVKSLHSEMNTIESEKSRLEVSQIYKKVGKINSSRNKINSNFKTISSTNDKRNTAIMTTS